MASRLRKDAAVSAAENTLHRITRLILIKLAAEMRGRLPTIFAICLRCCAGQTQHPE